VQLIDASSTKVLWACSVNKQKGGSKSSQSMAEAVAKHLKEFVEHDSEKGVLTTAALDTTTVRPKLLPVADNSQAESQVDSGPPTELVSIIVKSTPPECDINVDGKWMGSTPSTIRLTPGDHNISIEKDEMRAWQRTMTVTAGGGTTIDATLEKP
jgi:PEGA domain